MALPRACSLSSKVAGLPAAQVQRAAYQIEHRMVAHLVEERVVAEKAAPVRMGDTYTLPRKPITVSPMRMAETGSMHTSCQNFPPRRVCACFNWRR